jgi:hypothetical protein
MNKTAFLGNGINYLSDFAISWDDLLIELMGLNKFEIKFLPNLMTYERLRLNWESTHGTADDLKLTIADKLKNRSTNEFYKRILKSNFTNYITTNYDYSIVKSHLQIDTKNSFVNNSNEELYSIRRNISLLDKDDKIVGTVWNIHGEIEYPKTIMLGMNHYCGSVGKIDLYLKGKYNFSHKKNHPPILTIEEKIKNQSFDEISWVELFFSSNVHIAGFGFDFGEIDLWWVLTKRARLMSTLNPGNKIYYYTKPFSQVTKEIELESRKRDMLKSLYVEVIEIELANNDYKKQWNEFIDKMNSCSE